MLRHRHSVVTKEVKVEKFIKSLNFLSFLLIIALLHGCTYHIKVKQEKKPEFQEQHEKIPLNVGLYLSDRTRNYFIAARKPGADFKLLVGDAISENAPESLRMIFPNLTVIDDKDSVDTNVDRIITLDFERSTNLKIGTFAFSEHTAWVELQCKVYDKSWNLLWKDSAHGKISDKPHAGAAVGGVIGLAVVQQKLGEIVNESLTKALEHLNEQILKHGKDPILKAN